MALKLLPEKRISGNVARGSETNLPDLQEETWAGNVIGAENYYQHAEHYFKLMSSTREAT
jgi:hypothetical protein